jgi:hypothetical protein
MSKLIFLRCITPNFSPICCAAFARVRISASTRKNEPKWTRFFLAEEERFELSREIAPPYSFSKAAPSATWVLLLVAINFAFVTVKIFKVTTASLLLLSMKIHNFHRLRATFIVSRMAEEERFELSKPLRTWRFSRPLESTTIRLLQIACNVSRVSNYLTQLL